MEGGYFSVTKRRFKHYRKKYGKSLSKMIASRKRKMTKRYKRIKSRFA